MKMLPSASTYLLLGVLSWGSASPKSTGGTSVDSRLRSRGRGKAPAALEVLVHAEVGAVEALAPAPGLTFRLHAKACPAEHGGAKGPGRRPQGRSQPERPLPGRALGTTPFSQSHTTSPAASYRSVRPSHTRDLPPPPLLHMTLLH